MRRWRIGRCRSMSCWRTMRLENLIDPRAIAGRRFVSLPGIDAHHHFWGPSCANYPSMNGPEMAPIRRPYGPNDLARLVAASGADASIVVQCRSDEVETRRAIVDRGLHGIS